MRAFFVRDRLRVDNAEDLRIYDTYIHIIKCQFSVLWGPFISPERLEPMPFEWDETKRQATLEKHGIDFVDAVQVFDDPYLRLPATQQGEERWIAIAPLQGIFVAVVYTMRGEAIRIITARRARKNERLQYQALFS